MSATREQKTDQAEDAMAPMILVVGRSVQSVEALRLQVLKQGFRLHSDDYGTDGEGATATVPDVVLMDVSEWDLAEQVGAELRDCKKNWNAPLLCLVSPGGHLQPDAIAKLGADDYLLKPVRSDELVTRVQVALQRWADKQSSPLVERRRSSRRKDDQQAQTDSRCIIDEAGKTISIEGRALDLSPKEYELLRLLASNPGRTHSAQEIIAEVWSDLTRASAADVHQYIHMLRRKIERDPKKPCWILTVRGFGYKLVFPNDT